MTRLECQPVGPWARYALTQLSFVRLSSNPSVVGRRKTPAESVAKLTALTQDSQHRYLELLPSLPGVHDHFQGLMGHNQATDAYLPGLAATDGAALVALDRRIVPPDSVHEHIEVLVSDRF